MSHADNLANEGKRLISETIRYQDSYLVTRIRSILTELAQIAHDYDVKLDEVEDELRAEQELRYERNLR